MTEKPEAKQSASGNTPNLLNRIFQKRDRQREQLKNARMVIRGADLPLERNQMGWFRWYLHPDIEDVGHRALVCYVQEIPPGGRSGLQLHQGGRAHLIWQGKGYTLIDGVRHYWEAGDVLLLTIKPEGTTHQHFNLDPDHPAKLFVLEPNLYDTLGVDIGSGFEQLGDAPEDPEGYPNSPSSSQ